MTGSVVAGRRAHVVFIGATAVLAGPILVSAFLAPRPGTAAGDHVAAALEYERRLIGFFDEAL